jgi:hypothetical protein
MRHRFSSRVVTAALIAAITAIPAITACSDSALEVTNPNQPDVLRSYGTPRDVETIVSKLFQQMHNGQYGSADDIWTQTITMSMESHSQLGNFGMGTRAQIPRQPIDNSIGNNVAAGNFRDYDHLSRNVRSAANALEAMDKFATLNLSTGSAARDARTKALAYFNIGYGLGMLSMIYDSAAVILPGVPIVPDAKIEAYPVVNATALKALDSAIVLAGRATGQTLPKAWWSAPTNDMTMAEFVRLARSMKARFRAGVARTAAERAAVDWNAVAADASNGITADFVVLASIVDGWNSQAIRQLATSSGWSQMTPFILGMADTSGGYQTWLATPITSRASFLMKTPDARFPVGETRALQNASSGGTSRGGPPTGSIMYFRNRPSGEDTPGEPWGTWQYDNHRFWGISATGGNGPFIPFTVAENDMLAAEAYLRTGSLAPAVALIDKYRKRAKLAPITVATSVNDQVPGGIYVRDSVYDASDASKPPVFVRDTVRFVSAVPGKANCVPRVPLPGGGTACGNIMEAMKWEKRTETAFTGYAQWFIDSRGWGDLVRGTALDWPVPYQELYSRSLPSYTTSRTAAVGTYGF